MHMSEYSLQRTPLFSQPQAQYFDSRTAMYEPESNHPSESRQEDRSLPWPRPSGIPQKACTSTVPRALRLPARYSRAAWQQRTPFRAHTTTCVVCLFFARARLEPHCCSALNLRSSNTDNTLGHSTTPLFRGRSGHVRSCDASSTPVFPWIRSVYTHDNLTS